MRPYIHMEKRYIKETFPLSRLRITHYGFADRSLRSDFVMLHACASCFRECCVHGCPQKWLGYAVITLITHITLVFLFYIYNVTNKKKYKYISVINVICVIMAYLCGFWHFLHV